MRTAAGFRPSRIHSVKELLAHTAPTLTRVTDQAARQSFWSNWLFCHLPTDIGARVSGVVERDGTLVIFAASAAWCARLRYAVQELEVQIRAAAPALTDIEVRVRPA
ncbi:MAG TPA: DciA family protein [Steroidobacteraceae bacterium]